MIEKSKFYHFLDDDENYILRFLDAQTLIYDLAMIHSESGPQSAESFKFFRDLILSSSHLISYLKHHESLGFFVDSDSPFFRFKLELHEVGALRTLILPKGFQESPQKVSATIRLVKFLPHQSRPYTSHLHVNDLGPTEIINHILETSYQVNATVLIGEKTDQSLLVMKLPSKKEGVSELSLTEYLFKNQAKLKAAVNKNYKSEQQVIETFQSLKTQYLHGKEIEFRCSCSKEQMISGVASLAATENIDDIFENGDVIETSCDYCHRKYMIEKNEVKRRMTPS